MVLWSSLLSLFSLFSPPTPPSFSLLPSSFFQETAYASLELECLCTSQAPIGSPKKPSIRPGCVNRHKHCARSSRELSNTGIGAFSPGHSGVLGSRTGLILAWPGFSWSPTSFLSFFFKKLDLFILCMSIFKYACDPVCDCCPWRPEEGIGSLGLELDGCKPLFGY